MAYKVYLCGVPYECPHDADFEHDNYFGCIPKDFSQRTGRSKSHRQTRAADGRYRWNGGCDTAPITQPVTAASAAQSDEERTP